MFNEHVLLVRLYTCRRLHYPWTLCPDAEDAWYDGEGVKRPLVRFPPRAFRQ